MENQGARPCVLFPLVVRWWYEHSHSPGNLRVIIFASAYALKSFFNGFGFEGFNRCGSKTVLLNLAAFASAGGPAEPAAGGAAGG